VKQGKMRLRRGTTAAFLSLQNYVFRPPPLPPPPSSPPRPPPSFRLFQRPLLLLRSPRICNRDASVLLPCRGHISYSPVTRSSSIPRVYPAASPSVSAPSASRRDGVPRHPAVHIFPRFHIRRFPPFGWEHANYRNRMIRPSASNIRRRDASLDPLGIGMTRNPCEDAPGRYPARSARRR